MNMLKLIYPFINASFHDCLMSENLFEMGIGNVVVAKKTSGGRIGMGVYLVDVFCLGVKDTFFRPCSELEYQSYLPRIFQNIPAKRMEGHCGKKLVEGAAAYARQFGINPHKDFKWTQKLLYNLDSSHCSISFEFGQEGKPFFCAGPNDSPKRCQQILELLEKKCGSDDYHYLMPMDPGE
jgi:hypothetical protein